MINRPVDDIKGLDDLKAAQALAKRQLERHLAGKPAMIDRQVMSEETWQPADVPGVLQTNPTIDHWTARAMGLERAAVRLESQNAMRREREVLEQWGRLWWAAQVGVEQGRNLCPGKVRHLTIRPLGLPRWARMNDPDTNNIEPYVEVIEELVYCPCVCIVAHHQRQCVCTHGQRGGISG